MNGPKNDSATMHFMKSNKEKREQTSPKARKCVFWKEKSRKRRLDDKKHLLLLLPPPHSLSKQMQNYDENDAFEKRPKLGNCNR